MTSVDLSSLVATETAAAVDQPMYVDGSWIEAADGARIDVVDPGTGEVFATVPDAGEADVDRAVAAARATFDAGPWSKLTPRDRSRLLQRIADRLRLDAGTIARLESRDNGKPLPLAEWDVEETAFLFEYYAGWTTKLLGQMPPLSVNALSMVVDEPVGVAALVTPWNFPILMAAQKVAPALAAGCACIHKPAEQTPLTALALARVAEEVELPAGALNVLTGRGESTGAALIESPGVDKISFTGSVPVGRSIMRSAAETFKRITLELGGKGPSIVYDDADLEPTIDGVCKAVFLNQGQVCGSTSRVFLQKRIYDDVLAGIEKRVEELRPGYGLDPEVTLGPLVSDEHRARVNGYIENGREDGATVAFQGRQPAEERLRNGFFATPTVFTGVTGEMRIAREEIFGPVMSVFAFDDPDDAIAGANEVEYGLTAAVWTTDLTKGINTARALEAGTVWVNDALQAPSEGIWGGVKNSGIGRELGPWGLEAYLEKKQVYVNLD
jgi:acyl-CoA reductase-like NAD-dependent aldehyde dehydrogenase